MATRRKSDSSTPRKSRRPTESECELQRLYDEHEPWALGFAERIKSAEMADGERELQDGQLEQAARIALWNCLRKWNPVRCSFKFYADRRIRMAICDELIRGGSHDKRRSSTGPRILYPMQMQYAKPEDLADRRPANTAADFLSMVEHCKTGLRRKLIRMMYDRGYTQGELARRWNMSASKVCELHRTAIEEIRSALCQEK